MMLTAPFPYTGGKRRVAETVWERFGHVGRYIEPFAGSLAVLLANPQPPNIEVVCDLDCMIANFWRAIAADPEQVAHHADWPTFHTDLTARHKWLVNRRQLVQQNCNDDAEWFDPQVAGWWVWGISHWIGGGFCSGNSSSTQIPRVKHDRGGGSGVSAQRRNIPTEQIPRLDSRGGGQGVSVQRTTIPDAIPCVNHRAGSRGVSVQRQNIPEKRPHVSIRGGGQGVSAQRIEVPNKRPLVKPSGGGSGISVQRRSIPDKRPIVYDGDGGRGVSVQRKNIPSGKRPIVHHSGGGAGVSMQRQQIPHVNSSSGGRGVSVQRTPIRDIRPHVGHTGGGTGVSMQRSEFTSGINPEHRGERLVDWFTILATRLSKCVVLCRGWQSAVSPTMLGNTSTQETDTAIFLDPPYRTSGNRRAQSLYDSDFDGSSEDTARSSYDWAVENGDRYKIAYCCRVGDFPVPDGWTTTEKNMVGYRRNRSGDDQVMFSPRCRRLEHQMSMFD